ncbi:hypothetical protein CI238_07781 [Colletotrichum incanum]|uniref:Uncharacterized protein n=1 Tax=Colletotrichum incanum TaxID=1573173 RepID=A0A162PVR6_COLIC|nr:hypothetical protein CI238_07781 [Colletotrichum incanum]
MAGRALRRLTDIAATIPAYKSQAGAMCIRYVKAIANLNMQLFADTPAPRDQQQRNETKREGMLHNDDDDDEWESEVKRGRGHGKIGPTYGGLEMTRVLR